MGPETSENRAIEEASPALRSLLSPLGESVAFPPDIPFQAAQARGKKLNATIGQVTDGAGAVLAPRCVTSALDSLSSGESNRAMLYSPVEGIAEVRAAWKQWQTRHGESEAVSTLPLVTVGLTHGLSLVADLFAGNGRPIAVPAPYWGNYRQTFATRTGARMLSAPAYERNSYNGEAIAQALAGESEAEPAIAILNLPSNPGGYSPSASERARIRDSLVSVAEGRSLMVVCDDAYAGLVYEEEVPARSMFWELVDLHPNLIPVKVDGATKELSLFGGRLGFLTFPFAPESAAASALESKVKCLTRAALGSPPALGQMMVLRALENGRAFAEVEVIRLRLGERYRELKQALASVDEGLLRSLPFNSGCFALLELGERAEAAGLDAETVRRHLLDRHDTGLIAIGPRHLRIAFCSVRKAALPELVERLGRGISELVARR